MLPALLGLYVAAFCIAWLITAGGCWRSRFNAERFVPEQARDKAVASANFMVFLLYPGLDS